MFERPKSRRPRHAANARTVLGKIRKMLREERTLEREAVRARLRASGKISMYAHGGRRVYTLLRYLRRRGEVTFTPTHVSALELLPAPRRRRGPSTRPEGPRSRRIRLARKRARALARRAQQAQIPVAA